MDVIVFAVACDQLCFNVSTHISENLPHVLNGGFREYIPAVFSDKDEVNLQGKNTMPAGAIFV